MVKRQLTTQLKENLKNHSAVALLGPRQTGKTTLARMIAKKTPSVYLDLESPADLLKLSEPLLFLSQHKDKLVILDEVHRKPNIFSVLRVLIDKGRQEGRKKAQFLILGSASPDLLKQSSESLTGRISYLELSGFNLLEVSNQKRKEIENLWLRGGFPESYLAKKSTVSFEWREDFIRSYLERDIPQMGFRLPAERLRRLWTMLAHYQGRELNASALGSSLDISSKTVQHYIDVLNSLLLTRRLNPWHANIKKRLVKSPRIYIRDSGLLHKLINVSNYDELLSHPIAGTSWEGFVMENLLSLLPKGANAWFYRTAAGAEIDLVIQLSGKELWAIEIKKGLAPKVSSGFHQGCEDIKANRKYLVYGGTEKFPIKHNTTVIGLEHIMKLLKNAVSRRSH